MRNNIMKKFVIGLVLFVLVLIALISCVFFAMIILEPHSREYPVVEGVEKTPIKEYLPFSFSDNDVITAKCQCRSLTNE